MSPGDKIKRAGYFFHETTGRKKRFTFMFLALFLTTLALMQGCTGYQTRPDKQKPRGYIKFDIKPKSTTIYINERYHGNVDSWALQIVPVRAGLVRVRLQSKGYIAQRFDLQVAPDEQVTLELALEPEFDLEPRLDRKTKTTKKTALP